MQTLNIVAKELFNKIRGRFPSVTIGDGEGNVTTTPEQARFYDFDFISEGRAVGKVSISLEDKAVSVVYNQGLVTNEDSITKESWYNFLKELRQFAKKRMLNFDTRDINKSNLNRRDYKFLANNRIEEKTMSEGKLYGTSRLSYQDFDGARLVLRHSQAVNQERAAGRTQNVESIYIESAEGERFKYPYKHINGARAMARHVAEGGNAYDDFGKHIVGLSEELSKLKKFKNYMGRSNVMAESLAGYVDVVKERLSTVKKTIESLQKKAYYTEAFENFEQTEVTEVPQDVAENWIDELTIRQFNEELKDVFPYIYSLVSENTRAKELGPTDLEGYVVYEGKVRDELQDNFDELCAMKEKGASDKELKAAADKMAFGGQALEACLSGADNPFGSDDHMEPDFESQLENGFEEMMGQFGEAEMKWKQTSMSPEEAVAKYGKEHVKVKKGGLNNGDDMVSVHVADESFDPQSEPSKQDMMADEFMTAYEKGGEPALATAMGISDQELDQEITEYGMEHGLHADDDRDDIIQGVIEQMIDNMDEGNAYAHAVKKAKDSGKKKGDEIDGPDGEKIKLEKEEQKTPLGEFILSYYDKEEGAFPKGETAVLTMVEKDYGEKFIEPAKQFIEKINSKVAEVMGYRENESQEHIDRMKGLAGIE